MKNFKPTKIASAALNVGGHARTASRLVRQGPRPMALEQRFMFDGAALIDAVDTLDHSTPDATLMTTADVVDTPLLVVESAPAVVRTSAQEAETLVKNYLASRTDAELFALFNGGQTAMDAAWAERLESLRSALTDGSFHLNVVEMDSASQFTAIAAFAAEGPNGEPTIFINSYWFGMFESPDATRTLVEELGHAIDNYLNPNSDTAGDEGEAFADVVLDGAASADTLSALSTQSDKGTVTVAGVSYEVEFANFNFVNAYQMITDVNNDGIVQNTENWADKEQESHTLLIADAGTNANTNYGGLGAVTINDDTNSQTFSGNDVSAIGISIGGTDYYGWISRPLKIQGKVVGFYFWTDQDFTNLATAQADGNQDADSADAPNDPGVTDNKGFILVVDQSYFSGLITGTNTTTTVTGTGIVWSALAAGSYKSIEVGSSSDRVDNALNSLLTPNAVQAVADTLTVTEGSGATIGNLLTNDTDPNGDTFTLTSYNIGGTTYSGAQLGQTQTITGVGTISITSTGGYTFTPGANYSGPVPVISYTITDKYGATSTATFSINVTAVNDAPDAVNDTATVTEDTPASGNLLGNDADPEGDPLTVTGFSISGQSGPLTLGTPFVISGVGTLTVNANGTYSFVPASNYTGTIPVVTYTISDGHGGTDTATLTLTMSPVNDAPVANPDNADGALFAQAPGCSSGSAVTESPQTGNVLTNDSDPDITLVAGTTHQVTA
ncbi:MAG: hypothetical protein RL758_2208, partial [Pseudomonadota bacterium]